MSTTTDHRAPADHPIHELLAVRWSPRSFDPTAEITDAQLDSLLEAARWAPSASNKQPRRFIVARRGTELFEVLTGTLAAGNLVWAERASALLVGIAVTADEHGEPHRWAEYDLGQALAHLSVQAHENGLHVHQMGGFDVPTIREAFALPETHVPVSVTAIGVLAPATALPEPYLSREQAERARKSLDELVIARA